MNIQSVSPAAFDALVSVPGTSRRTLLAPLTDVGSGHPTSPVVASFSLMRDRNCLAPAYRAARFPFVRTPRGEGGGANRTGAMLLTAAAPSPDSITRRGAIQRSTRREFMGGAVECLSADRAVSTLSILPGRDDHTGETLIPRDSGDVLFATSNRTIKPGAVGASYRRRATLAGMGLRFHSRNITYAAIADRRINADAGMFAKVAAE